MKLKSLLEFYDIMRLGAIIRFSYDWMKKCMSEKDKMLVGELYDANYNKELIDERLQVKDLCYEYNNTKPSNLDERTIILNANSFEKLIR